MSLPREAAKLVFATADLFLPSPRGPRILIYHKVGTETGLQLEVATDDFRRQIDWLVSNREIVSLGEALRRWSEPNSGGLVVLTFDDGYHDTYTTAFPMLEALHIPFTVYLATRSIEGAVADRDGGALRWEEVREMVDSGLVTVGSHTHTHADLRSLTSEDISNELETCDGLIEAHLGITPMHFAYPWGYWSSRADRVIRARYSSAVVGAPSLGHDNPHFDRFLIHRYPIQLSDGYKWFRRRLRGGLLAEEAVRRRLRGYRGPR